MNLIKEVAGEIAGMFAGDAGLALIIVALVAALAGAVGWARLDPLIAGGALLLGALSALVASVVRGASRSH